MTTSHNPDMQWIGPADNEMMLRVQQWLADGRTLAWLPIFNAENFPSIPAELLNYAERCAERHCWLINRAEDFLQIPDRITGWMLPEGDLDTDVVVGLWEGELNFCTVTDRRNGVVQTLQVGRDWETSTPAANT